MRPGDIDQLLRIKGVGPGTVERHGEAILRILRAGRMPELPVKHRD
jgi:hypothetical protein